MHAEEKLQRSGARCETLVPKPCMPELLGDPRESCDPERSTKTGAKFTCSQASPFLLSFAFDLHLVEHTERTPVLERERTYRDEMMARTRINSSSSVGYGTAQSRETRMKLLR